MRNDLAIILTVRSQSTRLNNKATASVKEQPLIYWIARRLSSIGHVIFATTVDKSDDQIASYVRAMDIPVHRGSINDVVTRMDEALLKYAPKARFVMRGLGDCPFMAGEIVERACEVLVNRASDAFAWALPPWVWPVYGAREFPYSRNAWNRIVANAKSVEREHPDMYFHANRESFDIVYHEPPPNGYFRNYRLEVDWQEDLDMVRELVKHVSMLSPLQTVVQAIDKHPEIHALNQDHVEKTGPTRYSYKQQRSWMQAMRGRPIVGWDNQVWQPPTERAEPVFCDGGTCLLGHAEKGILYRTNHDIISGDARISCNCQSGKRWIARRS